MPESKVVFSQQKVHFCAYDMCALSLDLRYNPTVQCCVNIFVVEFNDTGCTYIIYGVPYPPEVLFQ